MVKSDTVHIYDKIKTLEKFYCINNGIDQLDIKVAEKLRNKVNELVIGYNKIAKDFETYKKAYKNLSLDR